MILDNLTIKVEGGFIVRARDLHEALEIKKSFGAWSSKVIEKEKDNYTTWEIIKSESTEIPMIVSKDPKVLTKKYVAIKFKIKLEQFRNTNFKNKLFDDYIISLEMAKHLAMMSKSKKGEEIRDYFIQCEKELE